MSCALASPKNDVCANKRPVHGRVAQAAPVHRSVAAPLRTVASVPLPAPFAADAPEATFSLTQVRPAAAEPPQPLTLELAPELRQGVRTAPPSFREIRAGRAAAAARTPVAEVRIPIAELDHESLLDESAPTAAMPLPGMDGLVERVRRRTAARMQRAAVPASL